MEMETANVRLFAANRKRKTKVCVPWLANDKQYIKDDSIMMGTILKIGLVLSTALSAVYIQSPASQVGCHIEDLASNEHCSC